MLLFDCLFWFGESYKCNYSLNIQVCSYALSMYMFTDISAEVVSLPNLHIINYSYGFTGSTHDATAFEKTRMAQEHDDILEPHEWIWADSAYPVHSPPSNLLALTSLKHGLYLRSNDLNVM